MQWPAGIFRRVFLIIFFKWRGRRLERLSDLLLRISSVIGKSQNNLHGLARGILNIYKMKVINNYSTGSKRRASTATFLHINRTTSKTDNRRVSAGGVGINCYGGCGYSKCS